MNGRRERFETDPREPPVIAGRVPPHDLDAEAAVLAAGLLDTGALDVVLEVLEGNHFYSEANRLIFEAMETLRRAGGPVDVMVVASLLRDREKMQRVDVAYLGQIVDCTPAIANVRSHALIVSRKWQRRRLIATCHTIAGEGYGDIGDDGIASADYHEEWISKSEQRIFAVTRRAQVREAGRLGDIVAAEVAAQKDPEKRDKRGKVPTHFDKYDGEIGGIWNGDLIIIAARPGMGKTAFANRIARNVASEFWADVDPEAERTPDDYPNEAYIWSGEMPKEQVGQRFLAQESSVSTTKIRHAGQGEHAYTPIEMVKIEAAEKFLLHVPITIDDTPGISVLEFCSKVRRAAAEAMAKGRRLRLVVVDYLQKMRWPGKVFSRNEAVGNISNALKNLAMELGIPVIALCQLSRALESRGDNNKRPILSDLRESGDLEQDADQVVFIYRDFYYTRKSDPKEAELIFSKNRMGQTGTIEVGFWNWCTRFMNTGDA